MFNCRSMRDKLYQSRKQLKSIKLKDINPNYEQNNAIIINESLTVKNAVLFKKVRQSRKAITSSFFWKFNDKIMCRKAMNRPAIIIENEKDITQKLNR